MFTRYVIQKERAHKTLKKVKIKMLEKAIRHYKVKVSMCG